MPISANSAKNFKTMSDLLTLSSTPFLTLLALPILYWATSLSRRSKPKQTSLVFYVHDNFTGHDTTAVTVAGKEGPTTSILKFGTLVAVDALVTEGPDPNSREIGRARGFYMNSQLHGKGLHMVFSVVFSDGEFKGSTLEIQGDDPFGKEQREYAIVAGTGFFRFVKGFGIMTTEFLDIITLRAVLKHYVTVKHY
jgi:hypothetical protein